MQPNTTATPKLTLQIYWQHMRTRKRMLTAIFGTSTIGMISDQFIAPLLVANAFNTLSNSGGHIANFWHTFGWTLTAYAGLLLLTNISWRINVWLLWGFETEVKRELAERCFDFLLNQSNRFHTNRFGGALVSQTTKFVNAFERLFDEFAFRVWTNIVAFIATAVILLPKSPEYVLFFLIVTGAYVILLVVRTRKQQAYNIREASAESSQTAQIADVIANVQTTKTFAHEKLEQRLFRAKTDMVAKRSYDSRQITTFNELLYSLLNHSQNWLAFFFGLYMVAVHHAPIGTFYLIATYTFNLLERLWELGQLMRSMTRGFGDSHDMTQILQLEADVTDGPKAQMLKSVRGDIRFQKMLFAYPERPDKPLFENFDLHIKSGEKVGLVGHSGSGKTTLTKLILRFMDIQQGLIEIDGQSIDSVTQASLRHNIAYVSQEPLMFHRSVADNIRYGQLDASDKAVMAAAKLANAHEFVKDLSDGYETLVGERGTKLSGGQRQRVAIARAMLKNAPILLLDEATSALDSESEALIQDALWKLMEGRTALVIAHRLSTIQKMDRIVVLDHGKIVEQGSHKELIRGGGTYAALWNRQSGGFIDD
jgi:ATP-binding cassette subfamily B protein